MIHTPWCGLVAKPKNPHQLTGKADGVVIIGKFCCNGVQNKCENNKPPSIIFDLAWWLSSGDSH